MTRRFPWGVLGIEPTNDRKAVRSAYAAKLKAINPDEDVAGFTELRHARDEALWLAKEGIAVQEDRPLSDEQPDDWLVGEFDETPLPPPTGPMGLAPLPPLDAAPEPVAEQPPPDPKPARLLEILFPGSEFTEAALTAEEYEEASGLMHGIFADASGAAIDKQSGIEDWLAHYLASSWPRSGPLVEDAVAAFGWDRDAGRIDEHAPVAFLNARLHALAFLKELEQPGHQWHKAFTELRQPGPRSKVPWKGANIQHVTDLLVHIRENYPEVEEYLDGERVASYVEPDEVSSPWKWIGLVAVGLIFLARIGSAISDGTDRGNTEFPVTAYQEVQDAWSEAQKEELLDDMFGPGVSYGELADDAPEVFASIGRLSSINIDDAAVHAEVFSMVRNSLRNDILDAAAHAPFEELVAVKQYELDLRRWIRANGNTQECTNIYQWLSYPQDIDDDEDFRASERELARRLLDAGLLAANDRPFPEEAVIPGEVVQAVMDRTGMDRNRFDQAAGGTGTFSDRCAYSIAVLEVILQRPGTVSEELLRIR